MMAVFETNYRGDQFNVDLSDMPTEYHKHMSFLIAVARLHKRVEVQVARPPWSWVPFLYHVQAKFVAPARTWDTCKLVERGWEDGPGLAPYSERTIRALCFLRRETEEAYRQLWSLPPFDSRVRAYV